MSNKNQSAKKTTPQAMQKKGAAKKLPTAQKKSKKPLSRRARILLLILVGALSLGALVGGFFGIRALLGYGRDFNYMEADLSKYVTLSAEDLKNIKMTVRVDKPTEEDVESQIISLLVQHKTLAPGEHDPDAVIQYGSVVNFYYAGYLLSADGRREYFSGGSNLSNAAPYTLTIGSNGFIPGFEPDMIGVRPSDTTVPTIIKEGTLAEGDTVHVNVTGFHPNGKGLSLSAQPMVLTPALDEEYGEGFYELLLGATLDTNLCAQTMTLESAEGTFVYTNIRPVYKAVGGKAHTVEAYFPLDYTEASLQGKTAYFEVYIKDTTSYVLPELTDAFLTDTVGILPEKLASYEGSTLVERYKSYIWEALEEEYESALLSASEEAFWEKIVAIATVKRVPRAAWLEVYDDYMEDMKSTYEDYLVNTGYTEVIYPFETFCVEYLRLAEGESYKKHVRELSKQTAGEKMIFFYAIQLLEVAPNEEELKAAYDENLLDLAEQYSGLDESYYESQTDPDKKKAAYEEYLASIEKTKVALRETLGEEYLLESAYYNFSFPKLLSLTKIHYVGKGHAQ